MNKTDLINYCRTLEAELRRSIAKREAAIEKAPDGYLECHKNGQNFTWYQVKKVAGDSDNSGAKAWTHASSESQTKTGGGDGSATTNKNRETKGAKRKRTLISKKNPALATRLAIKGYNKDAISIEKKQLRAVQLFLKYFPPEDPEQHYIKKNAEYRRLCEPQLVNYKYTTEEWAWMNKARPIPQDWQKELTIPAALDYMVRSKSESDYISKFVDLGIAFRYEWPTELQGYSKAVFPDFRILDSKRGREYILEHFGRMDDAEYVAKCADKLEKYLNNGWLPGENLFISYETKDRPFTIYDAEAKIRADFPHLIKE